MDITKINELPSFKKLVRKRSRMVWRLSIILFLALCFNLYLMSTGAPLGAKTLYAGSIITVAVAYSVFIIFLGAFCCLFYVWWANRYLDGLIDDVKQNVKPNIGLGDE